MPDQCRLLPWNVIAWYETTDRQTSQQFHPITSGGTRNNRLLVYSTVRMAVIGRDQSAWRQRDVIDDVAAVDDRELDVVERVSGERLDVAGERRGGRRSTGWLAWTLLLRLLPVMMKYWRQHELGYASRHAPVNHIPLRWFILTLYSAKAIIVPHQIIWS